LNNHIVIPGNDIMTNSKKHRSMLNHAREARLISPFMSRNCNKLIKQQTYTHHVSKSNVQ